jgi:hypothetical protein
MSPDSAFVVAALDDGTVRLWDLGTQSSAADRGTQGPSGPHVQPRRIDVRHRRRRRLVKLWDPQTGKDIDWIELQTPVRWHCGDGCTPQA